MKETPPRTWRRLFRCSDQFFPNGNTSTDVEKTCRYFLCQPTGWKHLHGRGEDASARSIFMPRLETPPRTWRRLLCWHWGLALGRNTSTDVEKTSSVCSELSVVWKHLHGRGEDFDRGSRHGHGSRNTSTDVEKTPCKRIAQRCNRKHLHGRGEDPTPVPPKPPA